MSDRCPTPRKTRHRSRRAAEQAWLLLDHAHTLGLGTTGDPR